MREWEYRIVRQRWRVAGYDPRYLVAFDSILMRRAIRHEDALKVCPWCETATKYYPAGDGWLWGTTFYLTVYDSTIVPGTCWEWVACRTCGGELYNGEAR